MRKTLSAKSLASFESRFVKTDKCWLWTAGKYRRGYGHVALLGENLAHRVAYLVYVGEIPDGRVVCHSCDEPSCVNPDHLFIGTQAENVADMKKKGRAVKATGSSHGSQTRPDRLARGEQNGWAKLTAEIVLEMRRLYALGGISYHRIGQMFSVTSTAAFGAITKKTWSHI